MGVVSGYDILALDSTPGKLDKARSLLSPAHRAHSLRAQSGGLFPPLGTCDADGGSLSRMWFRQLAVREQLERTTAETAAQACHALELVAESTLLGDAADLIVRKRLHRLGVVDEGGRLTGVLSRGDVLRATLSAIKAQAV